MHWGGGGGGGENVSWLSYFRSEVLLIHIDPNTVDTEMSSFKGCWNGEVLLYQP